MVDLQWSNGGQEEVGGGGVAVKKAEEPQIPEVCSAEQWANRYRPHSGR